jgi:ABC-2 type transport system ATP-binding protein
VYAWAYHSRDGQFVPDRIEGIGSVDLAIPRLLLQGGTYDIIGSIVDYTCTHTYDFLRNSLRIDVLSGPTHESGGVAVLDGTWGNLVSETGPSIPDEPDNWGSIES